MQSGDIKEIQSKILEIFKEFNRICEKYNLRYFAIGGTCIGAIRHKGFIPWDDDLDVVMPFEDFKKFREIVKKELTDGYELCDYLKDEFYLLTFFKIQNINTTFVQEAYKEFPNRIKGVFIDIMPIAGCPKSFLKKKFFTLQIKNFYKLNLVRRMEFKERITLKSKIFWIVCKPFCMKKDFNYYALKWEKLLSKYSFSKDNDVFFAWRIPSIRPNSNFFSYDFFRDSIEVNFEDTTISVPIEYDKYLTQDFGDYMKLPPKEKQVPSHAYIVDLNKSYKEYMKEMIEKKDE